ncbi:MAG: glycosyltransferase [Anaerolineae bacterium]|nr:glycosyltransferase [Anaerolineae bacterium]
MNKFSANYLRWLQHQVHSLFTASGGATDPQRLSDVDVRPQNSVPLLRRALLSYVVPPIPITPNDPRFFESRTIYMWHAYEFTRVLNELGYKVDIIRFDDTKFIPQAQYDLFVGHGGVIFGQIAEQLPRECIRIYWSTGCYWQFHNEQELARLEALRARRGVALPPDRLIAHSEERALELADGIIGLGNHFTRRTYAKFGQVFMVNNMAKPPDPAAHGAHDWEAGKHHFLYYAGGGCVHKGLDLLLETFLQLKDQHLWICAPIEPEFGALYADALNGRPNIHLLGVIPPRSRAFINVAQRCNFSILPSCSEGQPHSIVECMAHGLIPVVSEACGVDVDGIGYTLASCSVEHIVQEARMLSAGAGVEFQAMSATVRHVTAERYTERAFTDCWRNGVLAIMHAKGSQAPN